MAYVRPFILLLLGVCLLAAAEPSARELAKRAREYEKKGDAANAYVLYAQAAAADPSKREYWQRAQALQRRAVTSANVMPLTPPAALQAAAPAPAAPADVAIPAPSEEDLREARKPQPPAELEGSAERKSFQLRAPPRRLWEQVSQAYGLDVVFDGEYPETGDPTKFELSEADYRTSLHALSLATESFFVPISPKLMLVASDTEPKRRDVENTVALWIPIPEPVSIQEAQELARSVQEVMEIQKFTIDAAQRVAILRDRVSKVVPAQLLFRQLLNARGQVALDVQLISADRSRSIQLGLDFPTTFPIQPTVKSVSLAQWSLGSYTLGLSGLTALLRGTNAETRTLYKAEMRAIDGQPADLAFGTKYPIATQSYIGTVPPGEEAFTPPPSFNFEDLGLVLKITPKVHDASEVTLDIGASFKLLKGESLNGIPVIVNREVKTQVRLSFDEAAIVAGLASQSDIKSMSGLAGVISVPVLGTVLGRTTRTQDDVQILLLIKPRLLQLPASERVTQGIWLGSETRPRLPL